LGRNCKPNDQKGKLRWAVTFRKDAALWKKDDEALRKGSENAGAYSRGKKSEAEKITNLKSYLFGVKKRKSYS